MKARVVSLHATTPLRIVACEKLVIPTITTTKIGGRSYFALQSRGSVIRIRGSEKRRDSLEYFAGESCVSDIYTYSFLLVPTHSDALWSFLGSDQWEVLFVGTIHTFVHFFPHEASLSIPSHKWFLVARPLRKLIYGENDLTTLRYSAFLAPIEDGQQIIVPLPYRAP